MGHYKPGQNYEIPDHKDETQEGYYSIFQIDYLHIVLNEMTLQLHLDSYMESRKSQNTHDWLKEASTQAETR